jgi:hypothetical protein
MAAMQETQRLATGSRLARVRPSFEIGIIVERPKCELYRLLRH